ncbi:hypothetical protein ACHAW5_001178 [Stephanodiscus triporus]|uniref:Uncharacterized protein n=1 Tax=Stephanodiscus triporus TaxID=2934178 RepID=A0ABD3MRJ5_9STRA
MTLRPFALWKFSKRNETLKAGLPSGNFTGGVCRQKHAKGNDFVYLSTAANAELPSSSSNEKFTRRRVSSLDTSNSLKEPSSPGESDELIAVTGSGLVVGKSWWMPLYEC